MMMAILSSSQSFAGVCRTEKVKKKGGGGGKDTAAPPWLHNKKDGDAREILSRRSCYLSIITISLSRMYYDDVGTLAQCY